jgi:hypothetical protein
LELEQAFEARVALPGSSDKRLPETFAIRSALMKKFCLAGAAAVLLIGTTAYGFAQSGDSSPKMSQGHEMQKRGSAPGSPGASGYAPGHRHLDNRGTLRDRDDRMMNHDRD